LTREEKIKQTLWLKNHRITEEGVIERKCSGYCKEWKPETTEYFYYKNKSKSEKGFSAWCKECSVKLTQKNYDPIRHTELTNFYYHNDPEYRKRKIGYAQADREAGKTKIWRQSPRGKQWQKENNFKRKHKNHRISKNEWIACKEYFKNESGEYCCAYCGFPISQHYKAYGDTIKQCDLHKEHVNHKGKNDLSNCIPACNTCNCSKHTMEFDKWYNENNPVYTQERYNKIIQWLNNDYKLYIEPEKPKRIYKKRKVS
jgi:hypothetical protein